MGPAQEVSERQNISNLLRDHSCHILAAFCPCPIHLPEAKLNTVGLLAVTEEISRHPRLYCIMWLLVITLMQICNKMKRAEQGKVQNVQFEEKWSTKKCNVENRSSSAQEDKKFKEKLDDAK